MRRYWQPAALVDELAGNRPVKPVRLLGENLVLFRDEHGRYGLIERALSASRHRSRVRAARRRRPALRVPRLAVRRRPASAWRRRPSRKAAACAQNIRQKAYPVVEKSGILFAYLGPGEPPAFPHFDCFVAPATPHLRVQGPDRLQLAAVARSRHRSGAHLVPAPLLPRRGSVAAATASCSATTRSIPTCR